MNDLNVDFIRNIFVGRAGSLTPSLVSVFPITPVISDWVTRHRNINVLRAHMSVRNTSIRTTRMRRVIVYVVMITGRRKRRWRSPSSAALVWIRESHGTLGYRRSRRHAVWRGIPTAPRQIVRPIWKIRN